MKEQAKRQKRRVRNHERGGAIRESKLTARARHQQKCKVCASDTRREQNELPVKVTDRQNENGNSHIKWARTAHDEKWKGRER